MVYGRGIDDTLEDICLPRRVTVIVPVEVKKPREDAETNRKQSDHDNVTGRFHEDRSMTANVRAHWHGASGSGKGAERPRRVQCSPMVRRSRSIKEERHD